MENNIFAKMAAITAELQTVAKNLTVAAGGGSYKAVSERDIIDAVKPLETKYGVYSYPAAREILESNTLESEQTYNGKATKKTTFFTRIKTVYRFVNVDNPADFIETTTFAEGIDPQDKGSGKAMTYADKYALMKAYKISTGDDPDQTASEPTHYSKQTKQEKPPVVCVDCGSVINATKTQNGTTWTADKIAAFSKKQYGRCLCPDCQRLERARIELEVQQQNEINGDV